jgi:hypothetical protein
VALQSRINGPTTDHSISSMSVGKCQHLSHDIAFANGDWEIQTALVEKAQPLSADVFAIDPVLIEYEKGGGAWVILEGWVCLAEGFFMNPNDRSF